MYSNCYTASSRATDSLCNFQSSRDASTASPMLSSTTATQLQQQQHYQVALSEYDPASQLNSDQRVNGMHHYHHQSDSPLSTESSMIIEAMSRSASPYSPEEKKVRIERYRSKRNQRNFNKKIKYACRKTLADSRPRIRGRFARNEEIVVMNPKVDQWSNSNGEEEDEEYDNWDNLFDSLVSANLADQEAHQDSSSFGVFC